MTELLHGDSQNPGEPLRVYADPAGHPFCVFVLIEHQFE